MEGYPSRSIFSFDFQGLNDEGIPQFINEKGQLTTTSINFQERNNLGHLKYSGTADPTDFGSFGNMFRLYGFKLNVFITYSFGNVIRLDPVFSESYSDLLSMPREFRNRWMRPGDETIRIFRLSPTSVRSRRTTTFRALTMPTTIRRHVSPRATSSA